LKKNFLDTSIVTSKDCPKSPLTPKINLANRTPDSFLSPQSSRNSHLSKGAETNTEADTSSTESTAESNLKDMIHNLSLPKSPKQDSPFPSERHVTTNPRNRTALLDHSIRTGKPPLQQKRNSIQSEPRTQSAMTKLSKPLHIREISDVTMDTSLVVPPAPSHDIQLGNLSTDSQEESNNELDTISRIEMSHTLRTSIIMIVTDKTLTSLNGQSRTQISILRQIADLYQLSPYDMVTVSRIDPEAEQTVFEAVSVDFVCFTIKDQFISRGNMHTFQKSLIKRWIYEGERVFNLTTGIKAYAREIRQAGSQTKSGIITEDTKITFRSRSSRIIWLVQISSEMWDYSNPYGSDV
jgi:Vacuolar membrane-associated protein Iml1